MKAKDKYRFRRLHEQLAFASNQLGWKFEENIDVLNRFELTDAFGFSIDGVEYFVSKIDYRSLKGTYYYAAVVIQHHGNRYEPPSEDEQPLKGDDTERPERLLGCILDAHWGVRRNWVMENLMTDEWP